MSEKTNPLDTLDVTVNGELAGVLHTSDRNRYTFTYDREATGREVSLTMPFRPASWEHDRLHPVFAQNLPEGYLKEVLAKTVRKLHGSGNLALLAHLGPYQIGRLGYQLPGARVAEASQREDLNTLLHSNNPDLFDELVEKYALRSGISGMQPKVLVDLQDKATVRSGRLIVKSWGPDFPQLALNEYYCMRVAKLAGLPVPAFDVSTDGRLFVMERFDVIEDDRFLGFEDGCTLTGRVPEEKYDSTYERLVETLATMVDPAREHATRRELFLSVLVSWLVRNGDAHLKNFGVLYENQEADVRLSPTFDIVCTTVYIERDVPALMLGGSKRWWPPKMLQTFGRQHCQLSPRMIRALMIQALEALRQVLAELSTAPAHFGEVGKRLQAQWEASASTMHDYLYRPG